MKPRSSPTGFTGLSRRDFLKFLPAAAGAVLLNGCTNRAPSGTPPPVSPTGEATSTHTASLTPEPSSTFTRTPEPPLEYLPPADGSFSVYSLPVAQFANNMPLLQALQERRSSREFRTDELPVPIIASIPWAGFGINRPDGKRTAPSAYNVQDIDIYLATSKGLYRYEAGTHSLIPLLPDDLRPYTGTQAFAAGAPLDLVYVSSYDRIGASDEECTQWSWAHSGCIAQNVYLACAALGLATVVRSTLDRTGLSVRMGLASSQHVTLSQTIGFPA